jgi:hypothetical protein
MQTTKIEGQWSYRSFFHAVEGQRDGLQLEVTPWAPPGQLVAVTDESGVVSGTLTFKPGVALTLWGSVTPVAESEGVPAGVRLTGEGLGAKYELRGYFVGERQIVGITLCWRGDLAKRPAGTSGPFVLLRAE